MRFCCIYLNNITIGPKGSVALRIDNESMLTRRLNKTPQIRVHYVTVYVNKTFTQTHCVNVARIVHFIICTLISVVSLSLIHSSPPLCLFPGFVGVVVGGFHRAQGVIDHPMVRLVRPNRQHHVPHGRIILETKSVRI